jgi:uncharacterized repeat protein (TIGR01451 family)
MFETHHFKSSNLLSRRILKIFMLVLISGLVLSLAQPASAQTNPPPGPGPVFPKPVYKSASKLMLSFGETLTYTIHLEIPWTASATADVTDPLPAGLDYIPGSANYGGVYDVPTRTISWTQVPIRPGTPVDLRFDVKDVLKVNAPTPVANLATITINGLVLQRQVWVLLMPSPAPPPGLSGSFKTAWPFRLAPGGVVTYTIYLLDNRTIPVTINVTDPVPAPLTYVDGSASNGGVYDATTHTITWTGIAAPPGQLFPLTFQATAPDVLPSTRPQLIRNTATIASAGEVLRRSADIILAPFPWSPLAGSFKTASKRMVAPGETFTYLIYLHNSSNVPVPAVVKDLLPVQVTYVEGSANAGGVYDPATRTITWDDLSVPEGSSLTLTFDVTAISPDATPLPVINTAYISSQGATLKRSVWVIILPNPGGDLIPPKVDNFIIDEKDVITNPNVTLHIAASDNVGVTRMFLKEWVLVTNPLPHWQEVQSSGWIPYHPEYPWTLSNQSGTHYIGVWVADRAGNRSHLTRRAIDFASLLLPNTHVGQGDMIPYLVYYPAGVDVTAVLDSLSGVANLFVWSPGNMFSPDQYNPAVTGMKTTITFTTERAGIYMFLVYGQTAANFDLSIKPGGGPRLPLLSVTPMPVTGDSSIQVDSMPFNPILPVSGLDPLGEAEEPVGPFLQAFVPILSR